MFARLELLVESRRIRLTASISIVFGMTPIVESVIKGGMSLLLMVVVDVFVVVVVVFVEAMNLSSTSRSNRSSTSLF